MKRSHFDQLLHGSAGEAGNIAGAERWLSLSNELHQARLMAVESIESRTEFDTFMARVNDFETGAHGI
jgi:hypothetical protein